MTTCMCVCVVVCVVVADGEEHTLFFVSEGGREGGKEAQIYETKEKNETKVQVQNPSQGGRHTTLRITKIKTQALFKEVFRRTDVIGNINEHHLTKNNDKMLIYDN